MPDPSVDVIDAPVGAGQLPLFDYAELEPQVRALAVEAVAKIRLHGRRAAESIVAIGEELTKVKAAMPHGKWLPWLDTEFGWSDRQARHFMRVWEVFKSETVSDLEPIDIKALYLLAAPSTPEAVRSSAQAKAENGERVTHGFVKDEIARHRETLNGAFPGKVFVYEEEEEPGEDRERRAAPKPKEDPAKTAAFNLDAELGGCIHTFTIRGTDPATVARACDPILIKRRLEEARDLHRWLGTCIKHLEARRE